MCGRYALYDTDILANRFKVEVSDKIKPNYNAAPSQTMPVITSAGLVMMRWGLIPVWAKDEKIGYKLINARSESVFEKPMWRSVVKRNRCLVPANGFYEWKKTSEGKQPYFIRPKDEEVISFAGIWETWKQNDQEWHTYSILTTSPNKEMKGIHDRMPVILDLDEESLWLEAENETEMAAVMNPYPDNRLDIVSVSKEVNNVKINSETLVGPISSK